MGNDVAEKVEPKERKLREHPAFVGNRRREDDVESGKAVRRHDEQAIAEIVNVPDLPTPGQREVGKMSLPDNAMRR